jgi:hypothetical protein
MSSMLRLGITVLLANIVLVAQQLPDVKTERPAPAQPIAYSHKLHAGQLKLECTSCHTMPGDGESATLPPTEKCMSCHATIKKDSPEIAKLAAAQASDKPVEWAPVYRIPEFVFFSHKKHLSVTGVTCENCHGPVKEREVMRREKDLSMGACMECHVATKAQFGCTACHDQR